MWTCHIFLDDTITQLNRVRCRGVGPHAQEIPRTLKVLRKGDLVLCRTCAIQRPLAILRRKAGVREIELCPDVPLSVDSQPALAFTHGLVHVRSRWSKQHHFITERVRGNLGGGKPDQPTKAKRRRLD